MQVSDQPKHIFPATVAPEALEINVIGRNQNVTGVVTDCDRKRQIPEIGSISAPFIRKLFVVMG